LPAQRAVVQAHGELFELDGALSSAIVPGRWRVAGFSEGYAVFTSPRPPLPLSASTREGRALPVDVLSSTTKSEVVQVQATGPATVVRSVAWDPGWTATVSVNSGPPRGVPVTSVGLVQQVQVPAGHDRIEFRYRPPHLVVASVLSLGACAVLAALGCAWALRRRREARGAGVSRADAPG
jgi:hypothetical protein